jgi:hypothetical protein
MAKTKGVAYWKKKAWTEYSKYIRIRDALRTTGTVEKAICCSCGRLYPAFGLGCLQAGHFIPGRRNSILFEPACVHAQCYNCNTTLKGNWPGYYEFMLKHYGQDMIDHLLALKHKVRKFKPYELEEMRDHFKKRHRELEVRKGIGLEPTKIILMGETYEDFRLENRSLSGVDDMGYTVWC